MEMQQPLNKELMIRRANENALEQIQSRIRQNVNLKYQSKSPTQANLIMTCLKNHFVFYNLSDGELENIRDKMLLTQVKADSIVYDEGSETHCFFIVSKGQLEETVDGQVKKKFKQMDGFGQIAMLYKTDRNSTVKAIEDCQLWVIDRQLFKEAVEEVIIRDFQQNRKCLQNLRFFNGLSREHKDIIASSLLIKKFAKNQTIIKEGDPGSCFYYLKDGYASAYKGSKLVKKLMKGDSFGEQSLYYNTMRQLSVKADEESTLLILPRDTLYKVMGQDVYQVTFKNFIKWSFESNESFENLKKNQIDSLIQKMKLSSYKVNETIFRKGISGFQKLVVVIEGQLKNTKNGAVVANKGQVYGQQFLLSENKNKIMEDEIIMNSYGVLAELTDYKIVQTLNLSNLLKKNQSNHRVKLSNFAVSPIYKALVHSNLQQFTFVDQIKMGQFGPLFLIKSQSKNYFVLRSLQKKMLQQYEVTEFINNESKILQQIYFPFICSFGRKFHTPHYVYQIIQYVQGKDFDKVMEQIGLFSSKDCQFYAACIILILEYLSQKCIIARDIKPENFMVDSDGYLKLINLAVGKKVSKENKSLSKTYTIIGTPHYMAPDIILGKGYNNMVDLWSLGIMMYEFMCGYLPFGDSADNAYQIYEQIMRNQLKFPQFMIDKRAKKIIEQFLSHNPDTRLEGSFDNIKSNPWFNLINWQKLQSKQISPELIPMKPLKKIIKQAHKPLLAEIKRFQSDEAVRVGLYDVDTPVDPEKWKNFGEYIV